MKGASTSHAAEHFEENPLELFPKDTVDDKVDRTVDGDEEVIGLSEGMIQGAKMLKQGIKLMIETIKYIFSSPLL